MASSLLKLVTQYEFHWIHSTCIESLMCRRHWDFTEQFHLRAEKGPWSALYSRSHRCYTMTLSYQAPICAIVTALRRTYAQSQRLLGHSCHSTYCSFYCYYLNWAHACRQGPSASLTRLPLQFMIHATATHLSEMFLSKQPPWATSSCVHEQTSREANKWVIGKNVKQTSVWSIVKTHAPRTRHGKEE